MLLIKIFCYYSVSIYYKSHYENIVKIHNYFEKYDYLKKRFFLVANSFLFFFFDGSFQLNKHKRIIFNRFYAGGMPFTTCA